MATIIDAQPGTLVPEISLQDHPVPSAAATNDVKAAMDASRAEPANS
jgi:hypothetical protein